MEERYFVFLIFVIYLPFIASIFIGINKIRSYYYNRKAKKEDKQYSIDEETILKNNNYIKKITILLFLINFFFLVSTIIILFAPIIDYKIPIDDDILDNSQLILDKYSLIELILDVYPFNMIYYYCYFLFCLFVILSYCRSCIKILLTIKDYDGYFKYFKFFLIRRYVGKNYFKNLLLNILFALVFISLFSISLYKLISYVLNTDMMYRVNILFWLAIAFIICSLIIKVYSHFYIYKNHYELKNILFFKEDETKYE